MSEFSDKLGKKLIPGDVVAYPHQNKLALGVVIRLNPKMVRIKAIVKSKWGSPEINKYPDDCVKIEGPEISMYLIKHSN
ncbi:MAG: hypothetical protein EBV10_10005 [Synechococcaceae bacterium WB6_1A_059]|nr:hypothetical protein [Synechococcaceae bacterium WB6_1A_059]